LIKGSRGLWQDSDSAVCNKTDAGYRATCTPWHQPMSARPATHGSQG